MSELETLKKEIKESKEAQDKMKETIEQLVETLKDIQNKGKEKETDDSGQAAQEGSMFKLEGFNKKDMIKPPVYDMEPSTFLNWSELFTTYMMSIDSQWEGILKKLQKTDVALSRSAVDDLQNELKMTPAVKKAASHALYINLLGYTGGKAKSRVTTNSIDMSFESYRYIYHKGKNATKMNIVNMKAEVLRPARATKIDDIEEKLNAWKDKQRYLEDVGTPPMDFDQKKTLLISILPVSVTEYIIKNPAMTSDDEGSYDALEAGLMEYLGLLEMSTSPTNRNRWTWTTITPIRGTTSTMGNGYAPWRSMLQRREDAMETMIRTLRRRSRKRSTPRARARAREKVNPMAPEPRQSVSTVMSQAISQENAPLRKEEEKAKERIGYHKHNGPNTIQATSSQNSGAIGDQGTAFRKEAEKVARVKEKAKARAAWE